MINKSLVMFAFTIIFLISLSPACATKKYVRTRVEERTAPLEGRTAELESGSKALKMQADNLENRTNNLDETTRKLQGDLTNLDQRSSQGIEDAKNQATMARKDALAETSKVNNRVNNLDNWQEKQLITLSFKLNQYTLSNENKTKLDSLINELSGQNGYIVEVQGFTDSTGTVDKNRKLSQMRAQSVFQYLVEKDVPSFKVNIVGLGELKPISDNHTKIGRAENRRVEVKLLINEGLKKNQLNAMPE
jgi:outer membrane protein OmpA-like peptidoglycan-associated protein